MALYPLHDLHLDGLHGRRRACNEGSGFIDSSIQVLSLTHSLTHACVHTCTGNDTSTVRLVRIDPSLVQTHIFASANRTHIQTRAHLLDGGAPYHTFHFKQQLWLNRTDSRQLCHLDFPARNLCVCACARACGCGCVWVCVCDLRLELTVS